MGKDFTMKLKGALVVAFIAGAMIIACCVYSYKMHEDANRPWFYFRETPASVALVDSVLRLHNVTCVSRNYSAGFVTLYLSIRSRDAETALNELRAIAAEGKLEGFGVGNQSATLASDGSSLNTPPPPFK